MTPGTTQESGAFGVDAIGDHVVDRRTKGLPGRVTGIRIGDIKGQGWNVLAEDLPLPLMVLKRSSLLHNIELMQRYCRQNGVELAPHGKTTMAPQLFEAQLAAGAWGLTAASVEQLQVYRHYGASRVIFANQLVGKPNLQFVCEELRDDPGFEILPFIDSVAAVETLARAAERYSVPRPIDVLLEVGYPGGRTGIRHRQQASGITAAIADSPRLALAGVAAFEGMLPVRRQESGAPLSSESVTIESHFQDVISVVDDLVTASALPEEFIVTAGGSIAFDRVIASMGDRWPNATVVLRSGCYITHDHVFYRDSPLQNPGNTKAGPWLQPALELWSYVHSIPEPGFALLTFGRRDVGFDYGLPVPLIHIPTVGDSQRTLRGWEIVSLNDQHGYLKFGEDDELRVGDRVVLGVSHPCTTFDKWSVLMVVDDEYNVVDAIKTFF